MRDEHDRKTTDLIHGWRVGFARVSTDDRDTTLQRDALERARCNELYEEKASGKNPARPELAACLKSLRPGDTLVVWRLDRLGRSLTDLVKLVTELAGRGIGFESLTEKIDTGSATGKLVFHMFAALAEFERNLIRERTQVGLAAARARGRNGGRKSKLKPNDRAMILQLMNDRNAKPDDVAKRFMIGRATLYRVWAQEKAKVES